MHHAHWRHAHRHINESLIPKSSCWHKFGVCTETSVMKFLWSWREPPTNRELQEVLHPSDLWRKMKGISPYLSNGSDGFDAISHLTYFHNPFNLNLGILSIYKYFVLSLTRPLWGEKKEEEKIWTAKKINKNLDPPIPILYPVSCILYPARVGNILHQLANWRSANCLVSYI